MMGALFTVDGRAYDVYVTSLKRSGNVTDGEAAGRTKSGRMRRDIVGTYYNYSMELQQKAENVGEYDALYEVLTAPVDSHILIVPYGQTTLRFEAYVTKAEDELLRRHKGRTYWGKLSVTFTAMAPQRT